MEVTKEEIDKAWQQAYSINGDGWGPMEPVAERMGEGYVFILWESTVEKGRYGYTKEVIRDGKRIPEEVAVFGHKVSPGRGRKKKGREKEMGRQDGSRAGVKTGRKMYGLMLGTSGYFVSEGTVTEVREDGFSVSYRCLPHGIGYRYCDIGKNIFADRGKAEGEAESLGEEKRKEEREDFAGQNMQPFGKF